MALVDNSTKTKDTYACIDFIIYVYIHDLSNAWGKFHPWSFGSPEWNIDQPGAAPSVDTEKGLRAGTRGKDKRLFFWGEPAGGWC